MKLACDRICINMSGCSTLSPILTIRQYDGSIVADSRHKNIDLVHEEEFCERDMLIDFAQFDFHMYLERAYVLTECLMLDEKGCIVGYNDISVMSVGALDGWWEFR